MTSLCRSPSRQFRAGWTTPEAAATSGHGALAACLSYLTGTFAEALRPPADCPVCKDIPSGRCHECGEQLAMAARLRQAFRDIGLSESGTEALACFTVAMADLAGTDTGQMFSAACAAHLMRSHGLDAAEAVQALAGGGELETAAVASR